MQKKDHSLPMAPFAMTPSTMSRTKPNEQPTRCEFELLLFSPYFLV
jgi:hypothetical protein